jgi:hypothetical protein
MTDVLHEIPEIDPPKYPRLIKPNIKSFALFDPQLLCLQLLRASGGSFVQRKALGCLCMEVRRGSFAGNQNGAYVHIFPNCFLNGNDDMAALARQLASSF